VGLGVAAAVILGLGTEVVAVGSIALGTFKAGQYGLTGRPLERAEK
jgi:hypothetical protein